MSDATTTRAELIRKAEQYRKQAAKAEGSQKSALYRKARNYYEDAGRSGLARFCERFI